MVFLFHVFHLFALHLAACSLGLRQSFIKLYNTFTLQITISTDSNVLVIAAKILSDWELWFDVNCNCV